MDNRICNLNHVKLGPERNPRLEVEALQIMSGVTAVLGKSGAGKTSLLNLIVGFDKPDSGRIEFANTLDSDRMPISWVPADFGLWSHLNVQQHIQMSCLKDDHFTQTLLKEFDLESCRKQLPETLSMGQKARLAVARSLATRAKFHVMDEPFAHVDPARVDQYWNVLREYLNATESSLIFASHTPHIVMREANHVICIHSGQILWTGKPTELYQTPPSYSLGSLLGPLNWFDQDEQRSLSPSNLQQQSARPEQVVLNALEDSSRYSSEYRWKVEQNWKLGTHRETLLSNEETGNKKTVYHQTKHEISEGTLVHLKLLTLFLFCLTTFFASGCGESAGTEPRISTSGFQQSLLPAEEAMLPAARGMTYSPSGDLLVLDNVGRVLKYGPDGELIKKWWMPDYDVGRPEGICVLQDGRMAVADTHYNRVVIFDENCEVSSMFGENGHGPGQFIYSSAIAQDDEGFLYVAEYGGNDRIQKFTTEGEFVLQFGAVGTEDGEFQRPSGLVWHKGTLYVADAINNRVQAFSAEGQFLRVVADAHTTGLYYPYDISLGPENSLFIIEYGAGRMTEVSLEGELLGRYGTEGRGEEQFWTPWGIAVSQSGEVAVADTGNRRVVKLQLN